MAASGPKLPVDRPLRIVAGLIGLALLIGYVDVLVSAGSTNGHGFGLLVDQQGQVFASQPASRDLKLVAFGFAQCPDICPTTLRRMHRVLDALSSSGSRVTPLFVTIDPEHDTPQALGQYTSAFDARIVGITGAPREIHSFASTYGVYRSEDEPAGMGEAINHSALLYLLGHDNETLATYQPVASPESIAADIAARRRQELGR